MRMVPSDRSRRFAVTAITLAAAGFLPGCYERVVSAKGPGAGAVDVYEPNLKDDQRIPIVDDLENAVFGPKTTQKKRQALP